MDNKKWISKSELQKATKGRFHLHSQSIKLFVTSSKMRSIHRLHNKKLAEIGRLQSKDTFVTLLQIDEALVEWEDSRKKAPSFLMSLKERITFFQF
jgi:hypothetical protein